MSASLGSCPSRTFLVSDLPVAAAAVWHCFLPRCVGATSGALCSGEGQPFLKLVRSVWRVLPFHHPLMAPARAHPAKDNSLDHARFVPVDEQDPRFGGEGPCGLAHQTVAAAADTEHGNVGANQHGKWAECGRCGLRLGYWPRVGARGQPARPDSPMTVRRALSAVRSLGLWERCSARDVKAALAAARSCGTEPAGAAAKDPGARDARRANSWAPTRGSGGSGGSCAGRARASSLEPRKHIQVSLNVSPGAVVHINR